MKKNDVIETNTNIETEVEIVVLAQAKAILDLHLKCPILQQKRNEKNIFKSN